MQHESTSGLFAFANGNESCICRDSQKEYAPLEKLLLTALLLLLIALLLPWMNRQSCEPAWNHLRQQPTVSPGKAAA